MNSNNFLFKLSTLQRHYKKALEKGYEIIRCEDYPIYKKECDTHKVLVNRVDLDFSCKKARRIVDIFNTLGIKGTFFVRLHAKEYNPYSFENYRVLKHIRDSGHEIGYHSEVIDQSAIWGEPAEECLLRDIEILNRMMNIQIKGIASHGGMTGLNNLDFWRDKKPTDFGLSYEAYDTQPTFNLFHESFYASDSEWTRWKCYDKGILVKGDRRSLGDHVQDGHRVINSLIHPETWFDNHFYE